MFSFRAMPMTSFGQELGELVRGEIHGGSVQRVILESLAAGVDHPGGRKTEAGKV